MPAPAIRRGDLLRIRDERWTVERCVTHVDAAVVDVRGCARTNRGVRARFLLPFEAVDRLPIVDSIRVVTRRRWRALARHTLAQATPAYDSLRCLAAADIALLPFQLEPAIAVVNGGAARLLIADEVGLGKTVQAGLVIAETMARIADAHILVVAPAALREQWCQELANRFRLSPAIIDSAALERNARNAGGGANPWTAHPLIVTSVDYVKRPEAMRSLDTLVWDVVVVDEAHGIAGRSDRHTALTLLGERARTLVMLTATPHSGDDTAFSRLCAIGDLGDKFPLLAFHRTRDDAGVPCRRRTVWLKVSPSDAEAAMHRALLAYARLVWRESPPAAPAAYLAVLILLRRACSSAWSLARSVERRLSLLTGEAVLDAQLALPFAAADSDDDEPTGELRAPGLADAGRERRMLEKILTLAQAAQESESKAGAVRRLLRRTHEPAIVFTEYRDTLQHLDEALAGFSTGHLHGGLNAAARRHVLQQFESGGVDVLLATDAASEGLNLQRRCRLVINLELPWTPTRLEQRVGRVDRIGQRRKVHAVHLVAAGTSEESTVARLLRRMGRVVDLLGAIRSRMPSALDIAHCVVERRGVSIADPSSECGLPPGLAVASLRGAAVAEAARATAARALHRGTDAATTVERPFATAVRRARGRDYWAFRLVFVDADDEPVWETMMGIAFDAVSASPSPALVRRQAEHSRAALAPLLDQRLPALGAGVAVAIAGPIALAIAREEAIITAARARHGRLAAVVQRGLFDRRAEKAAAAQDAALREILSCCGARLTQLAARAEPPRVTAEAVFGLFRR